MTPHTCIFWNAHTLTAHKFKKLVNLVTPPNSPTLPLLIGVSESRLSINTFTSITRTYEIYTNTNNSISLLTLTRHLPFLHTFLNVDYALGVTLFCSNSPLHVIVVHLANSPTERHTQLTSLLTVTKSLSGAVLLGGDFNDAPSPLDVLGTTDTRDLPAPARLFYDEIAKDGYVDAWRLHHGNVNTPTHFHSNKQTTNKTGYTYRRLDRCYSKLITQINPHITPTPSLSDHAAVTFVIEVSDRPPPLNHSVLRRRPINTFHQYHSPHPNPLALTHYFPPITPPPPSHKTGELVFLYKLRSLLCFLEAEKIMEIVNTYNTHAIDPLPTPPALNHIDDRITLIKFNTLQTSLPTANPSRNQADKVAALILARRSAALHLIVDDSGTLLSHPTLIVPFLVQNSEKIFNATSTPELSISNLLTFAPTPLTHAQSADTDICSVTPDIVDKEITRLSRKLTRGPDGLTAAEYKCHSLNIIQFIKTFSNTTPPKHLFNIIIKYIPKPHTPFPPTFKNLRPIALENSLIRIISRLIFTKLTPFLAHIAGPHQHGFTPGRSSHPPIYEVNRLANLGWGVVFLDFERAFTNASLTIILALLHHINIHPNTIRWISYLFDPYSASIALGNKLSTPQAEISSGLRQGNCLSPTLFNLFISIFISILKHKLPFTLLFFFADDGAVAIPPSHLTPTHIHTVVTAICQTAKELGIPLNIPKTKTINIPLPTIFENVPLFKYLGIPIPHSKADPRQDVLLNKINSLAWTSRALAKFRLPPLSTAYFFNTFIFSKLTYLLPHFLVFPRHSEALLRILRTLLCPSRHYLGRAASCLVHPSSHGGLGIRDLSTHALTMKCIWVRVCQSHLYYPHCSPPIIVSSMIPTQITPLLTQSCDSKGVICSRKLYQNLFNQKFPPPDTTFYSLFSKLPPLTHETHGTLWKTFFNILPCEEHITRHLPVTLLSKCGTCGKFDVLGPSHYYSTCTRQTPPSPHHFPSVDPSGRHFSPGLPSPPPFHTFSRPQRGYVSQL